MCLLRPCRTRSSREPHRRRCCCPKSSRRAPAVSGLSDQCNRPIPAMREERRQQRGREETLRPGGDQSTTNRRDERLRECEGLASGAIVGWSGCAKLLDAGTCRGQVGKPVRWDRPPLRLAWRRAYSEFPFDHFDGNASTRSAFQACASPGVRTGYGIEATAWFESALSLLLESTAVTT